MALWDKSLSTKKIPKKILLKRLNPWIYSARNIIQTSYISYLCSLTASPTFLMSKILLLVERKCCLKTNPCWGKKIKSKYYWNKLNPWICQHFKTAGITHNFRSSTRCEKTSSSRTSMALKNKDLLGKNNLEDMFS